MANSKEIQKELKKIDGNYIKSNEELLFEEVANVSLNQLEHLGWEQGLIKWSITDTELELVNEIISFKVLEVFPNRQVFKQPENRKKIKKLLVQGLSIDDKSLLKTFDNFKGEHMKGKNTKMVLSPMLEKVRNDAKNINSKIGRKLQRLETMLYGQDFKVPVSKDEEKVDDLSKIQIANINKEIKSAKKSKKLDLIIESDSDDGKDVGKAVENLTSQFNAVNLEDSKKAPQDKTPDNEEKSKKSHRFEKRNETVNKAKDKIVDLYETPASVVETLLKFLPKHLIYYEPCAGNNAIVNVLKKANLNVIYSDKNFGENKVDFLTNDNLPHFDILITNPPYGNKARFIEKVMKTGKSFALLLPFETLGQVKCQELFMKNPVRFSILTPAPKFLHKDKIVTPLNTVAWFFGGSWIGDMAFTFEYLPHKAKPYRFETNDAQVVVVKEEKQKEEESEEEEEESEEEESEEESKK
jgi:hypothetical protein